MTEKKVNNLGKISKAINIAGFRNAFYAIKEF